MFKETEKNPTCCQCQGWIIFRKINIYINTVLGNIYRILKNLLGDYNFLFVKLKKIML